MVKLKVTEEDGGVRLDRLLRRRLARVNLAAIYRLIRKGGVRIGGKRVRQNHRLVPGDEIEIRISPSELAVDEATGAESVRALADTGFYRKNLHIIYEDAWILACDKPSSLVVHPGTGHTAHDSLVELVQAYLATSTPQSPSRTFPVHRLDRDTSGVILFAKDRQTLRRIHQSMRQGEVSKHYVLCCHGSPPAANGRIDEGLVKSYRPNGGAKVRVDQAGAPSETRYHLVKTTGKLSLVDVELVTGRTHQIRVHMAHIGCPLLGDTRYGNRDRDREVFADTMRTRRLYLHAEHISFPHPHKGKMATITAPAPHCFRI